MIWDEPGVANGIDWTQRVIFVVALLTLAVVLVRRYSGRLAPLRRALAPVLAGAIAIGLLSVAYMLDRFGVDIHLAYSLTWSC